MARWVTDELDGLQKRLQFSLIKKLQLEKKEKEKLGEKQSCLRKI